ECVRVFRERMGKFKARFVQGSGRLDALSPLAVLDRGYSIVHKIPEEKLVKDTNSLDLGHLFPIPFPRAKRFGGSRERNEMKLARILGIAIALLPFFESYSFGRPAAKTSATKPIEIAQGDIVE